MENIELELETLVDELMKDSPNLQLVKKLSKNLGIPFSASCKEQLTAVIDRIDTLGSERAKPHPAKFSDNETSNI